MLAIWILVACAGLLIAIESSRRAVAHAAGLVAGTRVPPFVVGITLVAVGTDLPEIANSIVSSATGHGDLNVGDSVGSAATQITLVLGLLPFVAGGFAVQRRMVGVTGVATCACLVAGALAVSNGLLSRVEALLLIAAWIVASAVTWRARPATVRPRLTPSDGRARHAVAALFWLGLVGAGAGAAIHGVVQVCAALSVPEYVISFFALSLGTSLPELVVDVTALRRGQTGIAVGDVFGSSLVDASLSIAVGPLLFPNVVDASIAVPGGIAAAAGVALATALLAVRGRHDRRSGAVLLVAYAAIYVAVLAPAVTHA